MTTTINDGATAPSDPSGALMRAGKLLPLLLGIALIAGCGSTEIRDGAPATGSVGQLPPDAVPRVEPRARYGNPPTYEVFGKTYRVMDSGVGFRERGVASWYGKKFHGRLTSSREPYDMYAMTAAHKSLPLPSYVRVRNLKNDRTIVVRVNDRGPFIDNRIIDLSYVAAQKLDIVRDGTGLVEIEVLTPGQATADRPVRATSPTPSSPAPAAAAPAVTPPAPEARHTVYAQVGAFGSRDNAERQVATLRAGGIGTAFVAEDASVTPTLYRVRIGPIRNGDQFDLLVDELGKYGIDDPYLVTD